MASRVIKIILQEKGAAKVAKSVDKVSLSAKNVGSAVAIANRELKRLKQSQKAATASSKKLEIATKGMTNQFIKVNLASRAISRGIILMTSAFASGIGAAISFEFTIAKISTISGVAGDNLMSLENTIKGIASVSPKTSTQVAQAALEMSKMGLAGKDLENALAGVVNLSVALDEEVSTVGQTLVNVKNVFQQDATEMLNIADKMFTTLGNSALNLEKFGTAFSFAGASARLAGVSFEELSGLMGVLADNGIKASTIGTQLRQVFTRLDDPTSNVSKLLGEQSIKTRGLSETLGILNGVIKNSGDAKKLFGQRAIGVINILTENISKIEELTKKTDAMQKSTEKAADTLSSTTVEGGLRKIASAWELLFINMNKAQGGFVHKVVTLLAEDVKQLADSMGDVVTKSQFIRDFFNDSENTFDGFTKLNFSEIKAAGELAWLKYEEGIRLGKEKAKSAKPKELPGFLPGVQGADEGPFREQQKKNAELAKAQEKARVDATIASINAKQAEDEADEKRIESIKKKMLLDKAEILVIQQKILALKSKEELNKTLVEQAKNQAEIAKALISDPQTKDIADLQDKRDVLLNLDGITADQRLAVHAKFLEDKKTMTAQFFRDDLAATLDNVEAVSSALLGFTGALSRLGAVQTENAVKRAEAEGKSEEQIQAIRKKGFESQKKYLYLQAIMSTSLGVARAFADYPFPMSAIVAGLVGAAGATEVATINQQKLATGFEGTVTQPTSIMVGEEGAEDVMIKPRSKAGKSGSDGAVININVAGDINGEEQFIQRLNRGLEELDRRTV